MPISPARLAAFDILMRVEKSGAYAEPLLHSPQWKKLSPEDHALATELVMGVLRWRSWLDGLIEKHSSQRLAKLDIEILTALRLGAYQLNFLTRIPQHAAVHESVELVKEARKRSATGFVNAVLRKVAESKLPAPDLAGAKTAPELSERSAHPLWLVERWDHEFGLDVARKICGYNQHIPETIIRLNSPEIERELSKDGVQLAPGKLLASARRLKAGDPGRTLAFREHRFAFQDEGSQLVALLVGHGERILDCCAAPGGKARILAQQNPASQITAVEFYPHRADLLRELVRAKNVAVVNADISEWTTSGQFDRVLADVPCSGTGTLARNPEIKWRLQPSDLADLQARQLRLLQAGLQRMAPSGRLVYSTCSLEREENQSVVEKALADDPSLRVLDCRAELERLRAEKELLWDDIDSLLDGPYLRTIPGIHPCDGFFAAIFVRA